MTLLDQVMAERDVSEDPRKRYRFLEPPRATQYFVGDPPVRNLAAENEGALPQAGIATLIAGLLGARNPEGVAGRFLGGRRAQLDRLGELARRAWSDRVSLGQRAQAYDMDEWQGQNRIDMALANITRGEQTAEDRLEVERLRGENRLQLEKERDQARGERDTAKGELGKEREERLAKEAADRPYLEQLRSLHRELNDPRTNPERRSWVQGRIAEISLKRFGMGGVDQVTGKPEVGPPATKGLTPGEKLTNEDRDAERKRREQQDQQRAREWAARNKIEWARLDEQKKKRLQDAARDNTLDKLRREEFDFKKTEAKKPAATDPAKVLETIGKFEKTIEGIESKIAGLKAGRKETRKIGNISKTEYVVTDADRAEIRRLEGSRDAQRKAMRNVAEKLGYRFDTVKGSWEPYKTRQQLRDGTNVTVRKK